jgi:prepilin-type processing-associated H-X9-DG protein
VNANPALCLATAASKKYIASAQLSSYTAGNLWAFGHPWWAGFNTVLPPNSPSCYEANNRNPSNQPGIYSASSKHPGGVQVTMVDGSVRFVKENIACGNYGVGSPPSFGIWGALGTLAGGETVSDF